MRPELRAAFLQAIDDVRSTAQLTAIEAAIDRGDVQAVLAALRIGPEFFAPLDKAIADAFIAGGAYTLNSLPKRHPATGGQLIVRFQGRHQRAETWVAERAGTLIREITEDQVALVRQAVLRGLQEGRNPRSTALDIIGRRAAGGTRQTGGLIGLTSQEAEYVQNMRTALADPATASDYFDRRARDRRFDPLVRRSIREGRPLGQADIDRIAGRYSDGLLRRRGERIARTETIQALNAGRQEGLNQIVESGEVPAQAVTKKWSDTGDARTRDNHKGMDGQEVPHDQPFISPSGARMMFPGDTSLGAPASEVIHCRCYMQTKVNWLSMAA